MGMGGVRTVDAALQRAEREADDRASCVVLGAICKSAGAGAASGTCPAPLSGPPKLLIIVAYLADSELLLRPPSPFEG